ncbi:hypothetical protein GEV33_010601 [Tenebrio molitor]|uniref:Uncharacterized protein n=1 Tax=Tenebrio molitor TaxID=7067 RepID=A0A8J6L5Z3_TENMO|nr:hypothetical protein GEV33_010601 [Tenebrio molitor]
MEMQSGLANEHVNPGEIRVRRDEIRPAALAVFFMGPPAMSFWILFRAPAAANSSPPIYALSGERKLSVKLSTCTNVPKSFLDNCYTAAFMAVTPVGGDAVQITPFLARALPYLSTFVRGGRAQRSNGGGVNCCESFAIETGGCSGFLGEAFPYPHINILAEHLSKYFRLFALGEDCRRQVEHAAFGEHTSPEKIATEMAPTHPRRKVITSRNAQAIMIMKRLKTSEWFSSVCDVQIRANGITKRQHADDLARGAASPGEFSRVKPLRFAFKALPPPSHVDLKAKTFRATINLPRSCLIRLIKRNKMAGEKSAAARSSRTVKSRKMAETERGDIFFVVVPATPRERADWVALLIARKFEKSPRGETATFSGRSRKGQAAAKGPPFRRFLQTRALIGVRPRRGEARNKRNQLLTQIMGRGWDGRRARGVSCGLRKGIGGGRRIARLRRFKLKSGRRFELKTPDTVDDRLKNIEIGLEPVLLANWWDVFALDVGFWAFDDRNLYISPHISICDLIRTTSHLQFKQTNSLKEQHDVRIRDGSFAVHRPKETEGGGAIYYAALARGKYLKLLIERDQSSNRGVITWMIRRNSRLLRNHDVIERLGVGTAAGGAPAAGDINLSACVGAAAARDHLYGKKYTQMRNTVEISQHFSNERRARSSFMGLRRRVMTPARDDTSPSLCSLCPPHSTGLSVFTFGNLLPRTRCPVDIYRFMSGIQEKISPRSREEMRHTYSAVEDSGFAVVDLRGSSGAFKVPPCLDTRVPTVAATNAWKVVVYPGDFCGRNDPRSVSIASIGGEFRAHGSRFNGTFHLAVVVFGKSARNLILDTCGMLIEAVSTVDSNPTRFRVEAAFSQKPPRRTDVPSRFVEAAAVGLHSELKDHEDKGCTNLFGTDSDRRTLVDSQVELEAYAGGLHEQNCTMQMCERWFYGLGASRVGSKIFRIESGVEFRGGGGKFSIESVVDENDVEITIHKRTESAAARTRQVEGGPRTSYTKLPFATPSPGVRHGPAIDWNRAGAEPPVRSPLSQSISGAPHPRDEKIDLANMQLHGLRFILLFDGRINRRLVERRAQRERACWRREGGKKMREESLPGITLMRAPRRDTSAANQLYNNTSAVFERVKDIQRPRYRNEDVRYHRNPLAVTPRVFPEDQHAKVDNWLVQLRLNWSRLNRSGSKRATPRNCASHAERANEREERHGERQRENGGGSGVSLSDDKGGCRHRNAEHGLRLAVYRSAYDVETRRNGQNVFISIPPNEFDSLSQLFILSPEAAAAPPDPLTFSF